MKAIVTAAQEVVTDVTPQLGSDGSVIALDDQGNFTTPFNTEGMYRGWIGKDGKMHVAILGN